MARVDHLERERAVSDDESDLRRKVLAHEQILQVLIAHMAETQPKFLQRLKHTFADPMRHTRDEHDYIDTAAYAERFVREIVRMVDHGDLLAENRQVIGTESRQETTHGSTSSIKPSGTHVFDILNRNGVWVVSKDGGFYGQYYAESAARSAAESAVATIVKNGGLAALSPLEKENRSRIDLAAS